MKDFKFSTHFSLVDNEEVIQQYLTEYNMLDVITVRGNSFAGRNCKGEVFIGIGHSTSDFNHVVHFEKIERETHIDDYI